ncbi:hypothetical protein HMPREF0321_1990 [Dermacoccus sp. Ellin185]|nr:hypothetical protein HMPREF0321_1990 [Dermacoccus sp. Ellin185]
MSGPCSGFKRESRAQKMATGAPAATTARNSAEEKVFMLLIPPARPVAWDE